MVRKCSTLAPQSRYRVVKAIQALWRGAGGSHTWSSHNIIVMQVPVGRGTLGRILNVIGEPVDEKGPIGKSCAYSGQLLAHPRY